MEISERDAISRRLKRIEGQVGGIVRMVESDRYCIEVVQQIQAARAALGRAEHLVLKAHASHCVAEALASGDTSDQRQKFDELIQLLGKLK